MNEPKSPPRRVLGDILEECQVVTHAQVEAALAEQRRTGKLFGEALLDLGFVSEDDLGWALSAQFSVPYIDLSPDMVDRSVVAMLEPDLMRKYKILPLVRVGDALTVAVADPTNREAIRAVEQATRLTLQISVASPRRVSRIIAELLGPTVKESDDSGDLLFREITRPTVSPDESTSPRPNPLGMLISRALKERVSEIHMDPVGDRSRVRFRRGTRLEDEIPIDGDDYRAMVARLRRAFGAGTGAGEPFRVASTVAFAEASLRVGVSLIPTQAGEVMIIELDETRALEADLVTLFEDAESSHAVRGWLSNSGGLLLVTGPPNAAGRTVWQGLLRDTDRTHRRVGLVGSELPAGVDGVLVFPKDEAAERGAAGSHDFDPFRVRGVDVVFTGNLWEEELVDRALMAAACGRLVVAHLLAPDAPAALALFREHCRGRSLIGRALLGVIEADLDPSGRPRASLMEMTDALRRAVDAGAPPEELARAAAAGGYRPLASRMSPRTDSGRKAA